MRKHPLAEIFGFPADNLSAEADRHRRLRLCPFNNRVPNCTKDKANNPLGVCSIYDEDEVVITCPVRFRQDWIVAEDAASFFFPNGAVWTSLTEVRLNDHFRRSAGNIDIVLVAYDDRGRITDFGALEIQGVYITGNVRRPFEHYMEDPASRQEMDWSGKANNPHPDYLSSSRKRLAPQLLFKGGILHAWRRKSAVAINKGFFETLPRLEEVGRSEAEMAWLIYDLRHDTNSSRYYLDRHRTVYTRFESALDQITRSTPGDQRDFVEHLQAKLDEKLEDENPPDAPPLDAIE